MKKNDAQIIPEPRANEPRLWRRVIWFITYWIASVIALGAVSYIIKLTFK